MGFAFGIEPWLRTCYAKRPEEARKALARHSEYFNTNPFMSSLVAGMVCALEEENSKGPETQSELAREKLLMLRDGSAAALAGIGDALVWTALRPFCAALALALLLASLILFPDETAGAVAVSVVGYLAAHNLPTGMLRWNGLSCGYRWKQELPHKLKEFPWQRCIRWLRRAGLLLAVTGLSAVVSQPMLTWLYGLPAVLALALLLFAKFLPLSAAQVYAAVCVMGTIVTAAGWL